MTIDDEITLETFKKVDEINKNKDDYMCDNSIEYYSFINSKAELERMKDLIYRVYNIH